MDETGHPGGTDPGENGNGAGPHGERPRLNGLWATTDGWSSAGAALEPAAEPLAPAWRPAAEPQPPSWSSDRGRYADLLAGSVTPPAQAPEPRSYEAAERDPRAAQVPASAPPFPYEGDLDDATSERPMLGGDRPSAGDTAAARPTQQPIFPQQVSYQQRSGYPPVQPTYALPAGPAPTPTPPARPTSGPPANGLVAPPANGLSGVTADGLSAAPPGGLTGVPAFEAPPAAPPGLANGHAVTSAPPAIDRGPGAPSGPATQRGPHPAREATSARDSAPRGPVAEGGASTAPMARLAAAFEPPRRPYEPTRSAGDHRPARDEPDPLSAVPPWQPADPPRYREPEEPAPARYRGAEEPAPTAGTGSPWAGVGPTPDADRAAVDEADALPQRVPAEPDVPLAPEPSADPPAETPQLARIATHLRRDDVPAEPSERPEGFDVDAVLAAVRGVPGVRDASLRTTPAGAHSLRLDLADGADAAIVSREVARLLQERLGLAAAPQSAPHAAPQSAPHAVPQAAPYVAPQSAPPAGYGSYHAPHQGQQPPGFIPAQSPAPAGEAPQPGARSELAGPAPQAPPARPGRRRAGAGRSRYEARAAEAGYAQRYPGVADEAAYHAVPPAERPRPSWESRPAEQPAVEASPSRPLVPNGRPGPRVLIDHVQVSTFGLDATVEVRLVAGQRRAVGVAGGPAVDGYVLRLCAVAAASAVDQLLATAPLADDRGRCFVEHAAVVPFGSTEVAVAVVLLVCGGWVEQLAGSALVAGDPRQAVVRATLAAVNRRLEALL